MNGKERILSVSKISTICPVIQEEHNELSTIGI